MPTSRRFRRSSSSIATSSPATSAACREHLDIRFAAVTPRSAESAVSTESIDVRWWPVDALPEGTREDLRPLVDAGLRLPAAPLTRARTRSRA